jgi:O-antigen ligase
MINDKMKAVANISILLILIIISWCFKASYFSYALIVFVLFLAIDGIYSYRSKQPFLPRRSREFYIMTAGILGFYLLFILTAILHWDKLDLTKALDYTGLCFPFFITWWILTKYDAEKGFRWGILIGAIIACCIGLYQWYGHPGIRIRSSYANPNHFGTMINLMLPLIGYYALKIKNHVYRIISVFAMIMQLVCLYLTGSRGALLALVGAALVGLFWVCVCLRKDQNVNIGKYVWVFLIVVLIGGGFSFYHLGQERHMDFSRMTEDGQFIKSIAKTGEERAQMIQASIAMWEDHKIFGVGAAHWGEAYYGPYRPSDIHELGHSMPHNMPLFFLSTGGLVGFAGYSIFVILTAVTLTKIVKKEKDLVSGLTIYMVFLSFFLQGLVDTTIINKIPARMYFALLGSFIPLCYLHLRQKKY